MCLALSAPRTPDGAHIHLDTGVNPLDSTAVCLTLARHASMPKEPSKPDLRLSMRLVARLARFDRMIVWMSGWSCARIGRVGFPGRHGEAT